MPDTNDTQALVLRVSPEGDNILEHCLANDRIAIGWPGVCQLLDDTLQWQAFRDAIHQRFYSDADSMRRAGSAGGHLWRFLRTLEPGDLVVVPAPWGEFYVCEVTGAPQPGDLPAVGFWRPVRWLNDKQPIPRSIAHSVLQSRMKVYGSTATADDLVPDIQSVVEEAGRVRKGEPVPTFESDLRAALVDATHEHLRKGRVESYKFEHVVHQVLQNLGATEGSITARPLDKGDDIVAVVSPLGLFELTLVVQVKHYYQLERPLGPHVVEELLRGMDERGADLGLIVTVGTIGEDTRARVNKEVDAGRRITLMDGRELAELYLDHCATA